MGEKRNLEQIREYWCQQASKHGQSVWASCSDKMMVDLVQNIFGLLFRFVQEKWQNICRRSKKQRLPF